MITPIQFIITSFINLARQIYEYIFSNVQFSVLWSWLPQDIQSAASTVIWIFFAIALLAGIRKFLPF